MESGIFLAIASINMSVGGKIGQKQKAYISDIKEKNVCVKSIGEIAMNGSSV